VVVGVEDLAEPTLLQLVGLAAVAAVVEVVTIVFFQQV
jgi:hypothetical protein